MASSGTRLHPITRDEINNSDCTKSIASRIRVEFQSSTDLSRFKGSHLKGLHSALFVGDSMWICGWNKNIIGQKNVVFLNVKYFVFDVICKNKFKYSGADHPMIMFATGSRIFFSKKNGNEIHSFNTKTHEFQSAFRSHNFNISAICEDEDLMYILDKNQADYIVMLDSQFNYRRRMATGLGNILQCNVNMCSWNHKIVLANSSPFGSIRCLDPKYGILWLLESHSSPLLMKFNPMSVSAIPGERVIFADGDMDLVSTRRKKLNP